MKVMSPKTNISSRKTSYVLRSKLNVMLNAGILTWGEGKGEIQL